MLLYLITGVLKLKNIIKTALLFALLSSPALAASENKDEAEDLVGLRYWNGIDKEVIETESGLKYKVLIAGSGRKPKESKRVIVHYRGLLLNGATVDSSLSGDEPATLKVRNLIAGWIEGVQLMPVGSVYVFLIPPELGYGEKANSSVPPNSTLIFEIELFGVK